MSGYAVAGYAVAPAEVERVAACAADAAESAREALRQLGAEAESLLRTRWRGAAASAFRLAWAEWLAGADAMIDALDETAVLLRSAGVGYEATDDAVRVAAS